MKNFVYLRIGVLASRDHVTDRGEAVQRPNHRSSNGLLMLVNWRLLTLG